MWSCGSCRLLSGLAMEKIRLSGMGWRKRHSATYDGHACMHYKDKTLGWDR